MLIMAVATVLLIDGRLSSYRCTLAKTCKHVLCFPHTVWLNCYIHIQKFLYKGRKKYDRINIVRVIWMRCMNKGKEEYDKSSVFRCRRHIVCVYKVQQPCNAKSRELYRVAAWNITGGFKRSNLKGTGENRRQDWILPSIFSQPADTFSKHLGDIKKAGISLCK